MERVRVYDPALCCSTGVCGVSVDPSLIRFASDAAWLKSQGVEVERFNLAQEPAAFIAEPLVATQLKDEGSLPIVFVGTNQISSGAYPDRKALADALGILAPAARVPLTVLN